MNLSHELTTSDTPPDPQLPQPLPLARPPTAALADPRFRPLTGRQGQGPAPGSGGRRTRPQSGHLMELPGNPQGCPLRPRSQDTPLTIPRESVQGPGDPNTLPQSAAAAKGRVCATNHSNKLRGTAGVCGSPSLGPNFELLTQVGPQSRSKLIYKSDRTSPPCQVASSVHFGMKAFITLESLLEYFVFSTETLQHEDDLIAHSKVSKERPQVQRENNIPQFHASLFFNLIIIFFLQVFPAGGGEVPCGGALLLPLKVIPGPSPTLPLIHSCLIKVDNIVFFPNNSLS